MKNKVFAIIITSIFSAQTFNCYAQEDMATVEIYQALEEAKVFCQNKVDPMIAQMAKQAGYDLEKLCASLNKISSSNEEIVESIVPERKAKSEKNQPLTKEEPIGSPIKQNILSEQSNDFEDIELQLFGYDLFAGEPETFQPNTSAPIEPDYLLGPGDQLNIQLYGKINDYFEQIIARDGSISFPEIGPVGVAGMNFAEVKQLISRKVVEEYIGVKVSVSLGSLRSMQVFVFGEAYKPGRYTVPALSTITNVLYLSGGVSEIAALRNIQVKRHGKIQAVFDLYDLLLSGDRSGDIRLQAGDTIFIPTVAQTASVQGQVRRPATYELKAKPSVRELIRLAGGLSPKAFQAKARIKRVDQTGFMTIVDVDLNSKKGLDSTVKNGDLLIIDAVAEESNNIVTLSGNVYHPGEFLWKQGLRVTDLIPSVDRLKPNTDLNFALLKREIRPQGRIVTLSVSLGDIFANPENPANFLLQAGDELIVFDAQQQNRALELTELVLQLKRQSRIDEVAKVVSISGAVHSAGDYPLTENMTITQLIAFAGGLKEQAYNQSVELTRSDFSDGKKVSVSRQVINLGSILSGQRSDVRLSAYDQITIRTLSDYREIMSVTISGEVLLPGNYTILEDETLSGVIARAGGLTESAHAAAAIFTRATLKQREMQKIEILRTQVQADIASVTLSGGKKITKENEQQILGQLDAEKALGRLVINLQGIVDGSVADIALRDGDHLMIPEFRQEVSVMGEVPWPSAHQYDEKLTIDDYLELAGGAKSSADKPRIYVIKVNGAVSVPKTKGWPRWKNFKIEPGDTVVVPMDMERQTSLSLWSEVTRIIYQLSLGAAAIKNL